METIIEQITLEKFRVALLTYLSSELLELCDIEVKTSTHECFFEDMIAVQIKGFLWGEQAKRQEVSYPKDWWQAFKKRWAPSWFLARWPVENTTIAMEAKLLYPDINISLPDERHFLHVSKTRIA